MAIFLRTTLLAFAFTASGCGGVHALIFPETPSLPENFQVRVFLAQNRASDLISDVRADVERDVRGASARFARPGMVLAEAVPAYLSMLGEIAKIRTGGILPSGIPEFPDAVARRSALASFAAHPELDAVSPLASLTEPERAPLFVRREAAGSASASEVKVWRTSPSPYVARVILPDARSEADTAKSLLGGNAPVDFTSVETSGATLTVRNIYTRGLFEPRHVIRDGSETTLSGEAFQLVLQCASFRFTPAGRPSREVSWPRIVVFESGTASGTTVRHTLIKNELLWNEAAGELSVPGTPSYSEVVRRSSSALFVHGVRHHANPSRSGDVFWYWRESSQLFSSRFGALLGTPLRARQTFASFQGGVNGLVFESQASVLADGTIAPLSSAQEAWLTAQVSPVADGRAVTDSWISELNVQRFTRGDWTREPDFQNEGIHHLDWSRAREYLLRSYDVPAAFSGAFPLSQQGAISEFCATGVALTGEEP